MTGERGHARVGLFSIRRPGSELPGACRCRMGCGCGCSRVGRVSATPGDGAVSRVGRRWQETVAPIKPCTAFMRFELE